VSSTKLDEGLEKKTPRHRPSPRTPEMTKQEEPVYYTARHLLEAINSLDESLLDLPLVLIHGKELTKPNLVTGIIPTPIRVDRSLVEAKKPSLLALADLQ
jgi:hypothetical protein